MGEKHDDVEHCGCYFWFLCLISNAAMTTSLAEHCTTDLELWENIGTLARMLSFLSVFSHRMKQKCKSGTFRPNFWKVLVKSPGFVKTKGESADTSDNSTEEHA